jgi:hypothetical protein
MQQLDIKRQGNITEPLPVQSGILQRSWTRELQRAADPEPPGILQRAAVVPARTDTAPLIVHDVLRAPGQPLDAGTRAFFEPRFAQDFSRVRVHTDAKAAESARSVNALAYTVGRDVVFGAGQYAPQTSEGQRVLAHELTHVAQQRRAEHSPGNLSFGPADDAFEQVADQEAQLAGGTHTNLSALTAPATLQRQPAAPQDDSKKKAAGEKTVVTQPPPQKIPAPQVQSAKKDDATKTSAAKPTAADKEKKGVEGGVSVGAETETKSEEGKTTTEVAGKYKLEVTIPITDKLQVGPLSFFKEVGLEGSAGLHTSTGPRSPLTSLELEATLKLISLDFEKVKVPFGLGVVDLGLSVSPKASLEYSPMEDKGAAKFGAAAEAEAKFKRSEKSPFFIKLNVGVEKTYDKEGNAEFKWSPAVWKTSAAVGVEF